MEATYYGYFITKNMKKAGFKESLKCFFVYFNPIDTNNILDVHRYLMKGKKYKIMFELIKKMFMGLLIRLVNASNHTKCVLLSNQKCII